jgi:hypothetical protein
MISPAIARAEIPTNSHAIWLATKVVAMINPKLERRNLNTEFIKSTVRNADRSIIA